MGGFICASLTGGLVLRSLFSILALQNLHVHSCSKEKKPQILTEQLCHAVIFFFVVVNWAGDFWEISQIGILKKLLGKVVSQPERIVNMLECTVASIACTECLRVV